jgi:hypothetical protein
MTARVLAVVERGNESNARQLTDLIDFCVGLRTSFGSLDLVLRGSAVACALDGGDPSDDLPGRQIRTLMRIGVQVWADNADVAELGQAEPTLLDGVLATDTDALATGWDAYEEVWFL